LSFARRFTQSCTIYSVPPLRMKSREWNSSCTMLRPAVIHCTSPAPIFPPPPLVVGLAYRRPADSKPTEALIAAARPSKAPES
jgi:hypothetical protein